MTDSGDARVSLEDFSQSPGRVVEFLDNEFGLIAEIGAARARSYDWLDVLVARAGTRQSAGQAIAGGRSVEDAIEEVVRDLGLPYEVRTRFTGRSEETAPCDVAIPAGGASAQIVCAAKGFDSRRVQSSRTPYAKSRRWQMCACPDSLSTR